MVETWLKEFFSEKLPLLINYMNSLANLFEKSVKQKIPIIPFINNNQTIRDALAFEDLKVEWSCEELFSDRIEILKQVLDAHYDENYALSTPVFLIHINSFFDKIKTDKKLLHERKQFVRDKIRLKSNRSGLIDS